MTNITHKMLNRRQVLKLITAINSAAITFSSSPNSLLGSSDILWELGSQPLESQTQVSQIEGASMSAFYIYVDPAYAIIATDTLGLITTETGNRIPLLAHKLTHVAPNIYAAHAGYWEYALEMLHKVHSFAAENQRKFRYRTSGGYDLLIEALTSIGEEMFIKYKDHIDQLRHVRIPLILTGPYRHATDVDNDYVATLLLWEGPGNFIPVHASRSDNNDTWAIWAASTEISNMMTALMRLPEFKWMLDRSPLATAKSLEAMHALVSQISSLVSKDINMILIGPEEEHAILRGNLIKLPNQAIYQQIKSTPS